MKKQLIEKVANITKAVQRKGDYLMKFTNLKRVAEEIKQQVEVDRDFEVLELNIRTAQTGFRQRTLDQNAYVLETLKEELKYYINK